MTDVACQNNGGAGGKTDDAVQDQSRDDTGCANGSNRDTACHLACDRLVGNVEKILHDRGKDQRDRVDEYLLHQISAGCVDLFCHAVTALPFFVSHLNSIQIRVRCQADLKNMSRIQRPMHVSKQKRIPLSGSVFGVCNPKRLLQLCVWG